MDVILSHFTAVELRVKCLSAVHDELQHAETQLHPALEALKRALRVVHASWMMYKAPLVFVDESSDVSKALEQLVASCNEIGTLLCELNRQVNSSGEGEASPSATDDEEDQKLRAEPKLEEVVTLEKKKAAKDTRGKVTKESKISATIIDLSLSDEEKETPVKDEPKQEMKEIQKVATIAPDEDATETMVSPQSRRRGNCLKRYSSSMRCIW